MIRKHPSHRAEESLDARDFLNAHLCSLVRSSDLRVERMRNDRVFPTPGDSISPLPFGDWLVDRALNEIRREAETRHLEPKSMDVLALLVERVGTVVHSEELLRHVWDARVVEPSAVHQRIADIRKALGDSARRPRYIETIATRGYRALVQAGSARKVSVAVTRFTSIGSDPVTQWFCDGVAEDTASLLARNGRLTVVSRTAAYCLTMKGTGTPAASRPLDTDHVLIGSGRTDGNVVRLTVQLIEIGTGITLWSEIYHNRLNDALAGQEQIAAAITRALTSTFESRSAP